MKIIDPVGVFIAVVVWIILTGGLGTFAAALVAAGIIGRFLTLTIAIILPIVGLWWIHHQIAQMEVRV